MKNIKLIILESFFILLTFCSFAGAEIIDKRDIARLHVRKWVLSEMLFEDGRKISAKEVCDSEKVNLELDFRTNGEVRGELCCNSFSGKYEINSGQEKVVFRDVGHTEMGCPDYEGVSDQDFASYIDAVYFIELTKTDLRLYSALGEVVLVYKQQ